MNAGRLIALLLGAAMLTAVATIPDDDSVSTGGSPSRILRGDIEDLNLPLLTGGRWNMAAHKGHIVVVNCWAAWCAPCRDEAPYLDNLTHRYQSQGVDIIGLSMDNTRMAAVHSFIESSRIDFPTLIPAQESNIFNDIHAYPTTFLIDRRGNVVRVYAGLLQDSAFPEDLARLLHPSPP